MKSVFDVIEAEKDRYNTKENTFDMFPVGTKVQVITRGQDFNFFSGTETGIVIENKYRYLTISVRFDKPRHFEGGYIQESFGFNPDDLIVLESTPECLYPAGEPNYCNKAVEGGEK